MIESESEHVDHEMDASSPPKPWKGKPVTREPYVDETGELRPLDAANFAAAGCLLWHPKRGALMAVEDRKGRRRFNFIGGKRDTLEETPRVVAARECSEETGVMTREEIDEAALVSQVPAVPYCEAVCKKGCLGPTLRRI